MHVNKWVKRILALTAAAAFSYSVIPTIYYRGKNWIAAKCKKEKRKIIYLTFDDGPSEYTDELLQVLRENDVKATFFMVSDFACRYPAVVKQIQQEGHRIGMHSKSHKNPLWEKPASCMRDLWKGYNDMLKLGVVVRDFRPPWGIMNLSYMRYQKRYGLQAHFWNVMAEDWCGDTTTEEIAQKLRKRVQPGSVICLHDGRGTNHAPARTIAALKKVLPEWKAQGYRFLTW